MFPPDPKAARAADRARVIAIDAEIEELEQRIHALQLQQEACQQRLDAYKYPVLTLPNEITSEIFLNSLPPYPTCPKLIGLNSPTNFTRICRKWREVAVATPKLWRAISTFRYIDRGAQTRAVQAWLERSGSCLLSIDLNAGSASSETCAALFLHRQRWQHLQLELAPSQVASLIKGPLPLLETLSLAIDGFEYTHPTTCFADFPRLWAVTLDNAPHGNWVPVFQLTSLTFEEVGPANYLPLLHGAVNLVRLNLIGCLGVAPPQSGIHLAHLETLVIVDFPSSWQILDVFTFPALHTLHISGALLGCDPSASLTPFIARSRCKLQEVLLAGECHFSEESTRATFSSIPSITFDSQYDWYTQARRGLRDAFRVNRQT